MTEAAPCPTCAARAKTRDAARAKVAKLNPRQLSIAREVATGKPNLQVSLDLNLSEKTVRNALTEMFSQLQLDNRTALARLIWEAE